MKLRNLYILSFLSWAIALCVIIFYLGFYSTHANVVWYEQSATLYDIWAVQVGGFSHIPFYATIRPGFLINDFFVFLGLNFLSLRTFSMFLTLLSSGVLAYSLISYLQSDYFNHLKKILKNFKFLLVFPWIFLLGIPSFNRPIDYESAPVLCIVLAASFFLHRDKNKCFPLLIGALLAYGSFSSISLIPAGILIASALIIFLKDWPAKISGIISLFFILLINFIYYGLEGIGFRLYQNFRWVVEHPSFVHPNMAIPLSIYFYFGICLLLPCVLAWVVLSFLRGFKSFKSFKVLQFFILMLLAGIAYLTWLGGLRFYHRWPYFLFRYVTGRHYFGLFRFIPSLSLQKQRQIGRASCRERVSSPV